MEPTTRIELVTSSLPRTRSYQLSYVGPNLERETGIEPATNSLEGCDSTTELLPPSQQRRAESKEPSFEVKPNPYPALHTPSPMLPTGGERRIRTSVARKERQIYSLLPLTTRPSLQNDLCSKSKAE